MLVVQDNLDKGLFFSCIENDWKELERIFDVCDSPGLVQMLRITVKPLLRVLSGIG